ncbi:MAG: hypothetical protein ABSC89_09365 [Verrucomicrobiota bacterium]
MPLPATDPATINLFPSADEATEYDAPPTMTFVVQELPEFVEAKMVPRPPQATNLFPSAEDAMANQRS